MAKTAKPRLQPVVQLTITLDDVTPKVARAVAVPFRIRLDALHQVIQAAMGWSNSHLYLMSARGISWGVVDPDDDFSDMLPAHRTRLCDLVADTGAKSFKYVYDFGGDWRHTIELGRMSEMPSDMADPFLLGFTGRCPPEDCGGYPGYANLLEALRDRKHPEHKAMQEWLGRPFDADHFRAADANFWLGKLSWPRVTEAGLRKVLTARFGM